jgi:hypothetical protein
VRCATATLVSLYGTVLSNSTKGGIRLSYSKNPLGVRQTALSATSPILMPGAFGGAALLSPGGAPHHSASAAGAAFDPQGMGGGLLGAGHAYRPGAVGGHAFHPGQHQQHSQQQQQQQYYQPHAGTAAGGPGYYAVGGFGGRAPFPGAGGSLALGGLVGAFPKVPDSALASAGSPVWPAVGAAMKQAGPAMRVRGDLAGAADGPACEPHREGEERRAEAVGC